MTLRIPTYESSGNDHYQLGTRDLLVRHNPDGTGFRQHS